MTRSARFRATPLLVAVLIVLFHWSRYAFLAESARRLTGQSPLADQGAAACLWDCRNFVALSNHYLAELLGTFPLYPLALRSFRWATPFLSPQEATLVLSNLFSVLCGILALHLGERLWPGTPPGSKRYLGYATRAWALSFVIIVFPYSQFASLGYNEGLFLSLLSAMLILVSRSRWKSAALATGLLSVTRPQGVWVMGAFLLVYGLEALRKRDAGKTALKEAPWVILASTLPLACYLGFNWKLTGDPIYFVHVQANWDRHFSLLAGFVSHLPRYEHNHVFLYASLYFAWRFFRRAEAVWRILGLSAFLMAEIPLYIGGYGYSYSRFMSSNLGMLAGIVEVIALGPWLWTGWLCWSLFQLSVEANNWFGGGYKVGP